MTEMSVLATRNTAYASPSLLPWFDFDKIVVMLVVVAYVVVLLIAGVIILL